MQIGEISFWVKQAAREVGFELAGVASIADFPELGKFEEWIAAGRAAEMKYLQARDPAGKLKRSALRSVLPWAQSVIVCAIDYNTPHPYSTDPAPPARGWISRYAWSREDYHQVVMRKLRLIEARLRESLPKKSTESPAPDERNCRRAELPAGAFESRCYVDTGPLVERVYAKYAGIGWIGKNTCILNQKLGSWLFLGVIVTSIELEADLAAPDRCGTCTRCIDACPTGALTAPYELDSGRCISYLTIEKRGRIAEELREGLGRHVFGCDICQDVCPWNRRAPATRAPEFQPRDELVNPALEWVAELTAEEFRESFRRSPLRRAKHTGLRRNAVIAMGNSGNCGFLPLLKKLTADADSVIAEAARWSVSKLCSPGHGRQLSEAQATNLSRSSSNLIRNF
jgi:epoxyqueuosine reductase